MPSIHKAASAAILASALAFPALAFPSAAAAASHGVECGQVSAYTAPDPIGPTDGSLQIGVLPAWTVAAAATLTPAIVTNLPSLGGNGPSCFALDFDDGGVITAMDFAPAGTITGPVVFDSGFDGYILADRLLLPTSVVTAIPQLGVLFMSAVDAGVTLALQLTIDAPTGQVTGFDGQTKVCGSAAAVSGGAWTVGKATIAKAFLDAGDIARLKKAGKNKACATIHSIGAITGEGVDASTSIAITVSSVAVTATAPPTSTDTPASARNDAGASAAIILIGMAMTLGFSGTLALTGRHRTLRPPLA